jgi:hypothetical protein
MFFIFHLHQYLCGSIRFSQKKTKQLEVLGNTAVAMTHVRRTTEPVATVDDGQQDNCLVDFAPNHA